MNVLSGGTQELSGLGAPFQRIGSAGNGLLTGLTEAWKPRTVGDLGVLCYMNGQKTGLNTGTDAGLTYVNQAGFPGGKALQGSQAASITTATGGILTNVGSTDFLTITWIAAIGASAGGGFFGVGEDNTTGFDMSINAGSFPAEAFGEIPGGDGNYNCFIASSGVNITMGLPVMLALWYTTADNTLHLQVNNGTVFPLVNIDGIGPPDATNLAFFRIGSVANAAQQGCTYIWQGAAAVANAVSQMSSLYTDKLQYSDFT